MLHIRFAAAQHEAHIVHMISNRIAGLAETIRTLTERNMPGLAPGMAPGAIPGLMSAHLPGMAPGTGPRSSAGSAGGRLVEVAFAPNPGHLRMWEHRPATLKPDAPLVIALHGCGQTAAGYDAGTGWSVLADRLGFAVVYPEQVSANNAHTCFNWFEPGDVARGTGEVASLAAMVEHALRTGSLDRSRVFVTGLSAGAAMGNALLACRPDLFAAGALIAGLPFGVAGNVREAMDAMFRPHAETGGALGARVRNAVPAGYAGPWPRVSVWHGSADHTVRPGNAGEVVKQWKDVHGLDGAGRAESLAGASRMVWRDRAGRAAVEQVTLAGMGHGVPVAPDVSGIGVPGPYILPAGVSSTEEIARFFGLMPASPAEASPPGASPNDPEEGGILSRLVRKGLDPLRLLPRLPGLG